MNDIIWGKWKNVSFHGFSYSYEKVVGANETHILKMPMVTPNKRGVNDIGFSYEAGITLFATLAEDPSKDTAIWQQIQPFDEINKTVSAIKIKNSGETNARVNIRVILN